MKGRLIVQSKISTPWPQTVCYLPPEDPIPRGWEGLEVVTEAEHGEASDLCRCQHRRSHHVSYRHDCLKLECSCLRFRETE